jgi:hypothetical protein
LLKSNDGEGKTKLLQHYDHLEATYTVTDRINDYAQLVIPSGNAQEPYHRWFHFKEGFSHQLLPRLLKDEGWAFDSSLTLLDPFLGSGTSLVSAAQLARDEDFSAQLIGCERNPVIFRIAAAKTAAAVAGTSILKPFDAARSRFWSRARGRGRRQLTTSSVTLNNGTYFDSEQVKSLLAMASSASAEDDPNLRTLFEAAVACSVEKTARLRRDGRALRHHPAKAVVDAKSAVRSTLAVMRADIARADRADGVATDVRMGDARDLSELPGDADWAIFSPPYPNNIDYTEVYKTEAWVLGLYANPEDMKQQRLRTLRSHPSVKFADEYGYLQSAHESDVVALLKPILESIPEDRYAIGRHQVVQGYTDDMLRVMMSLYSKMKAGTRACVVIGNSSHGTSGKHFVLAADLLLARVAELAGWTVDEIRICRRPVRRADSGGYLRESAVMLTR